MDCMEGKVINFERNTVQVRGYVFSKEEMIMYRILGVYNSVCARGLLDKAYMARFMDGFVNEDEDEIAIAETGSFMVDGGKMVDVLSVIVFKDIQSMQLYVIKNKELYLDDLVDKSFNGMFN